jgi:uncharacterized membrane protein (GlpM family)
LSASQNKHDFDLGKLRQLRGRDLVIRFLAGAATSLAAALIGLANVRVGGLFLAFPAILIAGLTLVAEKEGDAAAAQTAHGSVAGGIGLLAFAMTAALSLGTLSDALALSLASLAWGITTAAGYVLLHRIR